MILFRFICFQCDEVFFDELIQKEVCIEPPKTCQECQEQFKKAE